MSKGKNRIKPKDKDVVREAADIVRNSESDELALAFLQDTLEDDFPDLDLARMDLHEAIKGLGGKQEGKPKGSKSVIEDLNKSLGDFIEIQAKKLEDANRKKANTKKRSKSKKSAKTTKKAKTTKSAKSTKRATAKKSKKK